MTHNQARLLFIGVMMIVVGVLLSRCSRAEPAYYVDFTTMFLRQQISEDCGERTLFMADASPDTFWKEGMPNDPCYPNQIGVHCWEDGCHVYSYRGSYRNVNGDTLVVVMTEEQDPLVLSSFDQWIDMTYRTCENEYGTWVEVPGCYRPSQREYSTSQTPGNYGNVIWHLHSTEWATVYNSYCGGRNPYGPPFDDRWGAQVLAGLFDQMSVISDSPEHSNLAQLMEVYVSVADDEVPHSVFTQEDVTTLERIRDAMHEVDTEGYVGFRGVAVSPTTWGELKEMFR